ncbi:CCAAT/enhancer-binding protein zeta, partial [Asbolus verrucosus]
NLLAYIVNKLGDPSQKIASKAIYSLGQLLFKHPNMQVVVLNEVEKLLFRSNVSTKAQYYGLCFLSQFYLSHDSNEVARRLVEVYFSFFKACVKKGEIDSRMMSALLMGVNRAYPFAKLEFEKISDHIDTMYRVVHVANFNNSLHALTLLFQVSVQENGVANRFYSALYKKLIDPKLFTTTHQAMLLSLVYKAILKDAELSRVKIFIKRLLQLSLFAQPSFSCGILYLISQLMGKKTNIQSLVLKQSTLNGIDEDDDEERYHDVKNDEVNVDEENKTQSEDEDVKPDINVLNQSLSQPGWYHCANTIKKEKTQSQYNPLSRNPLYAGNIIKYSGDPLKDFTLIRFLDRFVFKNPKKLEEGVQRGVHPTFGKRKVYQPKGLRSLPVNSSNYLNENLKKIPVDELFMYSYLQKRRKEKRLKKETDEDDSDLESVQDEEFEDMLDKMAGTIKKSEDLDFLNDIGETFKEKNKKKNKSKPKIDDENISDEELIAEDDELSDEKLDEDELSDENLDEDDFTMNEDDKELLNDLESDEDEEIVFNDEESSQKSKMKKKKGNDMKSLFASAEEFASLLEEEGNSKIAPGGSNQFANKDNADLKQITWEDKRNRWLQGFNKAIGKNKMNKNKNSGIKRSNNGKFGNKSKKIKSK